MLEPQTPKPLVDGTRTFVLNRSWRTILYSVGVFGAGFGTLTSFPGDFPAKLAQAALVMLGMAVLTTIHSFRQINRIEVLPDRVRFFSRLRFRSLTIDDIGNVSWIPIPFSHKNKWWIIKPKRGLPVILNPIDFPNNPELVRILDRLALTFFSLQLQNPPKQVKAVSYHEGVLSVCAATLSVGGLIFQLAEKSGNSNMAVLFALFQFAIVLIIFYLMTTRLALREGGIVHGPLHAKITPYDQVSEIKITPDTPLKSELLEISVPNRKFSVDEKHLGSKYPLFRDLLLVRAKNAVIYGESDPAKLHLCTLPGPLDELHAKPIDEKTEAPSEASVLNETQLKV